MEEQHCWQGAGIEDMGHQKFLKIFVIKGEKDLDLIINILFQTCTIRKQE